LQKKQHRTFVQAQKIVRQIFHRNIFLIAKSKKKNGASVKNTVSVKISKKY